MVASVRWGRFAMVYFTGLGACTYRLPAILWCVYIIKLLIIIQILMHGHGVHSIYYPGG